MIVYTGDIHGDVTPIHNYVYALRQKRERVPDTIVILGDVGANYFLNGRDNTTKRKLNKLGVDIFCIHGNHEARPQTIEGYIEEDFKGAPVFVQPEYPHLKFAIDGEVYNLDGRQSLVIGGAYSVDKYYRLENGLQWFDDEQPSSEVKDKVVAKLQSMNWQVDQILSHTCPIKFAPVDTFLPGIDQSTVDTSTEEWLDEIEDKTTYDRWLCGHYHIDRDIGNFYFLMNRFMV